MGSDFVKELFDKINALTIVIENNGREIIKLQEIINSQAQEIVTLKEKLNKNSTNSSKPPSSKGLKKQNTKSLRGKTGKNQVLSKIMMAVDFLLHRIQMK